MRHLFFAGSFAIAAILSYGWVGRINPGGTESVLASQSFTDTTPKKKDSLKKKKYPGKDSMNRNDTSWPKKDSVSN